MMKNLSLFRKTVKFVYLPLHNKLLLFEALAVLLIARVSLRHSPFHKLAERLGTLGLESSAIVSPSYEEIAQQIGWAITTMARYVPWESKCLAQAISAWWMLNRRGVIGTVYFGVAPPDSGKQFNAHAWLRCGSCIVTGGPIHEKFHVLSYFTKGTS
jgi:hypothetical protein